MITATTPREAALELHALGLSVIPLHAPGMRLPHEADEIGKLPLITWKPFQQRRAEPEELRRWWTAWPRANVGLVTGAVSGVVVFDVDSAEGWDTFCALGVSALADGAGPWVAKTARGYHMFFAHPGNGSVIRNRAGLMPGVDVRGDGGYVVAPPSVHASGVAYTWPTPPGFLPLAPLPKALRVLLASSANGNGHPAPAADADRDTILPEGWRNDALYRLARSLLARGSSPEAITAALLAANAGRCVPPLLEVEVLAICDHAVTEAHEPGFEPVDRMPDDEARGYAATRQATRQARTQRRRS